ncbi:DUF4192 domain-containing protein [Flexivirga caeni]|uniref:DUF4192 family protein n=1 Tax=Flexivirga caeni TaxID=2294115 RepID=A0A3M9MJ29_9MICO|nr:DUF4192 family protein [Flexivirga caeni]
MSEKEVLINHGRLVALMPHLLGARPENSLVVIPLEGAGRRSPAMVVQIPEQHLWESEARRFEPYGGVGVAIVAFADHAQAEASSAAMAQLLQDNGAEVWSRVATDGDNWVQLDSGDVGTVSQADRDRVAVEFIRNGHAQPYDSMEQLRASFQPVVCADLSASMNAAAQHAVAAAQDMRSLRREQRWMSHAIVHFVATGQMPDIEATARLLCDVQVIPLRDHAFTEITRDTAAPNAALWKEIMRRSPEDARAPAASLAAFSMWLGGDGMQARLAIEQVPGRYELANLIGLAVSAGVDPAGWSTPDPESKVYGRRADLDAPKSTRRRPTPPPATGGDHRRPER